MLIKNDMELVEVNINDIRLSTGQRKADMAWVRELARTWDPDKFRPLDANRRADNLYYVTDGQHRLLALQALKYEGTVPCWVTSGLTPRQEAEQFLGFNNYKTVRAIDKFNSRLEAFHKDAVDINNILMKHNLKVGTSGPNTIATINGLDKVYKAFGIAILDETLQTIFDAYRDYDLGSAKNNKVTQRFMVYGLAMVLGTVSRSIYDSALMLKVIRAKEPGVWARVARSFEYDRGQDDLARCMRNALIGEYNKKVGRTAKRI